MGAAGPTLTPEVRRQRRALIALLISFAGLFIWSAIHPHDIFTWSLEVWPALAGVTLLAATYRRFRFTTFVYGWIWAHAVILLVGGHYTYALVPLGNWMQTVFHLARNDYDRIGHFAQGFVPALVVREFFLRRGIVKRSWMPYVVISCCLALSALYELLEWRTAVAFGSSADAFLGTQGDPWDTQEDMATALVGAAVALLACGRLQDRFIARLGSGNETRTHAAMDQMAL
jgi:putative membrane protein